MAEAKDSSEHKCFKEEESLPDNIWWFTFVGEKQNFDLIKYQEYLQKDLVNEFKDSIEYAAKSYNKTQSNQWINKWFKIPSQTEPVFQGNIFAEFKLVLNFSSDSTIPDDSVSWRLYWDPTIAPKEEINLWRISLPDEFIVNSMKIQKRIVEVFGSDNFKLCDEQHLCKYKTEPESSYEEEDDFRDHWSRSGNSSESSESNKWEYDPYHPAGEFQFDSLDTQMRAMANLQVTKDYTACGSDCDYCGCCEY